MRLALKREVLGGAVRRALRTGDGLPDTVVLVGGPAGDDEAVATVARVLPEDTVVGRGDVAALLGHRYAVAYGLAPGGDARKADLTPYRGLVITMYSTATCGPCKRLKRELSEEGIAFDEVDLAHDEAAADFVMGVNYGSQTVPTLRFVDGTTLTNPSLREVKEKLAAVDSTPG